MNSSSQEKRNKKFSSVFIYSSIIVAIVVIIGAIWPDKFDYINNAKMWITDKLGWYYLILTTIIVFFCIFLIFSPIGKLKLGNLMTNQNLILFLGLQCYLVQVWVLD